MLGESFDTDIVVPDSLIEYMDGLSFDDMRKILIHYDNIYGIWNELGGFSNASVEEMVDVLESCGCTAEKAYKIVNGRKDEVTE